ncbi:MAG TPA: alpha/beta fold hydrolase [Ktedonobacteraceae bacterium]|nr:alpha/beta fold hydrolase [Ktedonobacteraceae bacterium]
MTLPYYPTTWLPLWWEWNEVNLRMWNQILRDLAAQRYGSHIFSAWLRLSASAWQAWNRILAPWMEPQTCTLALNEVMEHYLATYQTSSKIGQVSVGESLCTRDAHERNKQIGTGLPPGIGQTPRTLLWRKNKAQLYRYNHVVEAARGYRTPLLMVYALINKPYILDMLPGRSFIEYLVKHGVDVYLLDWGTPDPEERRLRFDDLVMEYLPQAIQQVLKTSSADHLNLFGYCIGGILITLYAATHLNAPLSSIVLLATPLDFSHAGILGTWLAPCSFDVDKLVDTMGNVPPDFIRSGASLLHVVGAPAMFQESVEDERFLEVWSALSVWGMDGVPFPGEAFRQWIKDFYQGNKLITNHFMLAGQCVHLSAITTPIMSIAAESDHLIPLQQIKPTLQAVSSSEKELFILPGSHFGLVTSPRAVKELWPRVVNWLAKHSLAEV